MKLIYNYLFVLALASTCISCKKYLDVTPDNVGTLEYAFRNRNEAENYLFSCYAQLQQLQYPQYNVGFVTSGEVIFPERMRETGLDPVGLRLMYGTQKADQPYLNFWGGSDGGQPLYQAIRRCNIMLANIDQPIDLTESEKVRWVAEAKFLKAYYHFYLFRLYGPIPIVDKDLPINSSIEDVRFKRAPVDSVVNYLVRLLDESIPDLPPIITDANREMGRITRPIAASVKAEVLMTAASPLFNGNPAYTNLKNKDGESLFPGQYDAKKWDAAASACLNAINLAEQNGNKLHEYIPQGAVPSNLPAELRRVLTIQTAITEKWELNKEIVWALNPTFGFGKQEYAMPRLTLNSTKNLIAQGTLAVPISEQELFYTKNGVPINEDMTWDYSNRYSLRDGDNDHRYYIKNGYTTVKGHFDREPRFYASVAFDGGIWYGNGDDFLRNPEDALYVQARGTDSYAGPRDETKTNVTGYWPKKLVNYLTVYDKEMTWVDYRMPLVRLSGLYLLYAEALNEQGKPYTDVVPFLDKVRERAGLPGVVQAWETFSNNPTKFRTQNGMREIIHQERRIELAFEAQAGWDLRRWNELQSVMANPMQGWNIFESDPQRYYRPSSVLTPVFNLRNYLWPINEIDLLKNPNLVQNPGW